jgi:ribosomal protein S6
MEKTQKYELMVIVEARLNEDEKQSIFKEITDVINKNSGKIINSRIWLDKHKFTFRINKCAEGTYYLINLEAPGKITHILPILRQNERILRFVLSRVDSHAAVPAEMAHR